MIKVTLEFNSIADMIAHFSSNTAPIADAMKALQMPQHQANQPNTATIAGDDEGPDNTNAPATDSAGIPWDARIHSTKKAINADGTWRKRRGVTDAEVAAVETELRSRGAQQGGMYMPPQPGPGPQMMPNMQTAPQPGPGPQMMPPVQQYQQQPGYIQPGPGPQMMPNMQTAPQPGPATGGMDFNGFMQHLMGKMQVRDANNQPIIEHNYLLTIVQRLNSAFGKQFAAITDIANDPNSAQLIGYAQQLIAGDGRW